MEIRGNSSLKYNFRDNHQKSNVHFVTLAELITLSTTFKVLFLKLYTQIVRILKLYLPTWTRNVSCSCAIQHNLSDMLEIGYMYEHNIICKDRMKPQKIFCTVFRFFRFFFFPALEIHF